MKLFLVCLVLILFKSSLQTGQNQTSILNVYESINLFVEKILFPPVATPKSIFATPRKPQSLAILMNFGYDGTSSLHLMSDPNSVYWSDSGHCSHGKIYDPLLGCRDLFCMEGYVLGPNGCTRDTNIIVGSHKNDAKISPTMDIELTVLYKYSIYIEQLNKTNCTEASLAENAELFLKDLQKSLAILLEINKTRIQNLELINSETNIKVKEYIFNRKNMSLDLQSLEPNRYDIIESNKVTLTLKEKYDQKEKETIQLYFTLTAMSIEKYPFEVLGKPVTVANIIEKKKST